MRLKNIPASVQMLLISILISLLTLVLFLLSKFVNRTNSQPIETWERAPITVIIDAGHGGEDGGTSGKNGILEKELNLDIAKKLNALFGAAGVNTVMTRSDDRLLYDPLSDYKGRKKILDMQKRLKIAYEYENAIFISIHMNSFPEEKYSGLQVYFSKNNAESERLAKSVQRTTAFYLMPKNNRKIKLGKDIFLLDRISSPAILIECGFLSNTKECELLCTEEYRNELAFWIFYSIISEIQ